MRGVQRTDPFVLALYGTWKNPSSLYTTWLSMRDRCANPRKRYWANYGGRGITVCERWDDFANFAYDMGPTYHPGLTIDRINNDGPYSPENCRWATHAEQHLNRSDNHFLTYQDRTMTIKEWADETGLDFKLIWQRITRDGWTVERALTAPIRTRSAK